jgi:hypothetical protein
LLNEIEEKPALHQEVKILNKQWTKGAKRVVNTINYDGFP